MKNVTLWYNKPSSIWEDAAVLGNGILGAMIYGGTKTEQIQLNEETLWSGYPQDADNPECLVHLDEMRQLVFAGKYAEAQQICNRYLVCKGTGSGSGHGYGNAYGSFQTAGDLFIEMLTDDTFENEPNYRRQLNLEDGIAKTEFSSYTRTHFCSYSNNVTVTAIEGDSISCTVRLERDFAPISYVGNQIQMTGTMDEGKGLSFATLVRVVPQGGTLCTKENEIVIEHASRVVIFTTTATTYQNASNPLERCQHWVEVAQEKGYATLLQEHLDYFHEKMGRVELDFGTDESLDVLPTDERLERVKTGKTDNGLIMTYFQFGRYLLLSSSRGVLPANLQGLWSNAYNTIWSADYHININIQMNYWLANSTNLPELLEPFFRYIANLVPNGEKTAKIMYGCRGWVAHTITNPWGFTSPGESPSWGSFMCAGAWCCAHYWDYYLYTGDTDFLKKYYPVIKGSAEFFVDFLVRDPKTGYLVTAPSNSPENSFIDPQTGIPTAICAGPTMDNSILYELFTIVESCTKLLDIDHAFAKEVIAIREQLPPLRVGKYGQVMEWQEDFDEAEPGHRHMSSLYALHPSNRITQSETPALFEASKKTIARRLAHGGAHSGWSRAWVINFYARLFDGEKALENVYALLSKSTWKNLFDNHPPFQIDGNFGGTAGIAEMLLQSHESYLTVLPALPSAWANGSFKGLVARGGFEISAAWKNGIVTHCTVLSRCGNPIKIKINGTLYAQNTVRGATIAMME